MFICWFKLEVSYLACRAPESDDFDVPNLFLSPGLVKYDGCRFISHIGSNQI